MVVILEIEQWKKWWQIEGKIEILVTVIALAVVIPFWNHPLTIPIFSCFVAIWTLGKIFFRKDQLLLLAILSIYFLHKGINGLLSFYR